MVHAYVGHQYWSSTRQQKQCTFDPDRPRCMTHPIANCKLSLTRCHGLLTEPFAPAFLKVIYQALTFLAKNAAGTQTWPSIRARKRESPPLPRQHTAWRSALLVAHGPLHPRGKPKYCLQTQKPTTAIAILITRALLHKAKQTSRSVYRKGVKGDTVIPDQRRESFFPDYFHTRLFARSPFCQVHKLLGVEVWWYILLCDAPRYRPCAQTAQNHTVGTHALPRSCRHVPNV